MEKSKFIPYTNKMKIEINTDKNVLFVNDQKLDLYSKEGFEILSELWTKVGWNQKYTYTFSWFGRPVIQLPEDLIRMQEVIYRLKPDVILETGVAHGGSLIFYASLCKAMGKGKVIGIDIEIRPHNRSAIEAHELKPFIELVEGSSTASSTFQKVKDFIKPNQKVLVILDSNHTYQHVLDELRLYSPLVTKDSYIVATDGVMELVHDTPRGNPEWKQDNPTQAAITFLKEDSNFELEQPSWPFNESELNKNITHFPGAWLRRKN